MMDTNKEQLINLSLQSAPLYDDITIQMEDTDTDKKLDIFPVFEWAKKESALIGVSITELVHDYLVTYSKDINSGVVSMLIDRNGYFNVCDFNTNTNSEQIIYFFIKPLLYMNDQEELKNCGSDKVVEESEKQEKNHEDKLLLMEDGLYIQPSTLLVKYTELKYKYRQRVLKCKELKSILNQMQQQCANNHQSTSTRESINRNESEFYARIDSFTDNSIVNVFIYECDKNGNIISLVKQGELYAEPNSTHCTIHEYLLANDVTKRGYYRVDAYMPRLNTPTVGSEQTQTLISSLVTKF